MSNTFAMEEYQRRTTVMNPEQAIRLFKEYLADPYGLPVCALPLLLPTMSIFDGKNGTTDVATAWPSVISFLTAQRSPEQFKQLQIQLNNCRCPHNADAKFKTEHDLGWKIYHDRWERAPALSTSFAQSMTPFHCLIFHLFGGLFDYLRPLSVKRTAKGGIAVWPKTPADLLPHGPDVTIQSLEQWLEELRDPAPSALALLSELIRLCRTLIVPSMVASTKLPALVITTIREACAEAKEGIEALWFSPRIIQHVAGAFNQRISYVESFLENFSSRRTMGALTPAELFGFWDDNDKPFFDTANTVLEIYTRSPLFPPEGEKDPRMGGPRDSAIQIFREVTATMFRHLNDKYGISRDALDSEARELSNFWEKCNSNPLHNIRQDLLFLKLEQRCAMIGCVESLQSSSKLRRCGGCKILCWCSKEHQRLSWTDSRCAHRDVCKLMNKVVEDAGGNLDNPGPLERRATKVSQAEMIQLGIWLDRFHDLRDNSGVWDPNHVFHTLATHRQRNLCSAVGCSRAIAEPGQGNLKLSKCSGCGVFQYCNAECQLKAWKDPKAAHKEVCKLIKSLIEAGGGDLSNLQKISERMTEGRVSRPVLETVGH
ncbi:hypothetical protein B0H19DRAFT_1112798 [Mycena capillaripes]|nr:hypothetical protein B0H19DRAFT_1112798 [Mycena capillaripes]